MKKMRIFGFRLVPSHLLSTLVVFIAIGVHHESTAKTDVKTKLLLHNIRSQLARNAEETIRREDCELGLTMCKTKSEESEEKSNKAEEVPSFRTGFKSFQKSASKGTGKETFRGQPIKVDSHARGKKKESTTKEKHEKKAMDLQNLSLTKQSSKSPSKRDQDDIESKKKEAPIGKKASVKPFESFQAQKKGKSKEETVRLLKEEKKAKKAIKSVVESDFQKTKPEKLKILRPISKSNENDQKNVKFTQGKDKTIQEEIKKPDTVPDDLKFRNDDTRHLDEGTFESQIFFFLMSQTNDDGGNDSKTDKTCVKHKNIYLKQLKKFKLWALMMFDASAKFPSGILRGNTNQFGDFDECLSINAVFKKPRSNHPSGIRGKYCLANIDVTTDSPENGTFYEALERAKSFSFLKSTIRDPNHFIPAFTTIKWGLCLPDACSAEDVRNLIHNQIKLVNSTQVQITVNVAEEDCVVKRDFNFIWTKTVCGVLILYAAVAIIACYATFRDLKETKSVELSNIERIKKELENASRDLNDLPENSFELSSRSGKWEKSILAFSLQKNFKRLLEDEKEDDIGCINGLKASFSLMLFVAHKTIPLGWTPFSNRILLTKVSNHPITVILRTSLIYTDSFLLMSGLLTTYSLSKEMQAKGEIKWRKRIIGRYVRLTPALLAVLLFYAYLWDATGSGPLWNVLVKKNSELCRKYLWRNLLYVQNLFSFEYMCAPQTHHLALDMQLFALSPLFAYLLHKYGKVGFGILQAFYLLSSIVRYTSTSNNDLSVVVYHGMPVSQLFKTADLLYTRTLHRASSYLMGAIVGHYLRTYKGRIPMSAPLATLGWILAVAFGFYVVVSPANMAARKYSYDRVEAAQYAALSPVLWSMSLAWVIAACHLGFGGKLNRFLCHKVFLVFNRISYSFYLTQFLVFFYKVGIKRVPEEFEFIGSFDVNEFAAVVAISLVVTLLFDIPMNEIKKIILEDDSPSFSFAGSENSQQNEVLDSESEDYEVEEKKYIDTEEVRGNEENYENDFAYIDEEYEESYEIIDEENTDESFGNERKNNMEDEDADVEEETDDILSENEWENNGKFLGVPSRHATRMLPYDEDVHWPNDDE